jgi:hypothetical protein
VESGAGISLLSCFHPPHCSRAEGRDWGRRGNMGRGLECGYKGKGEGREGEGQEGLRWRGWRKRGRSRWRGVTTASSSHSCPGSISWIIASTYRIRN